MSPDLDVTDALSFIVPKTVLRLAMDAGVSPDTVRKTIKHWAKEGFLDQYEDGTYRYQNALYEEDA